MSNFIEILKIIILVFGALYLQIFFNFFFSSSFLKIFPTLIVIFSVGSKNSSFRALWIGAFVGLCIDSFNFSFSGYDTFLYAFFGALSGLMAGDNTKIKVEGIQRLPIFIILFNVFLFAKSLLVTPNNVDLLSWILNTITYYFMNMLPANIITIIIFILYFTIFRNEKH